MKIAYIRVSDKSQNEARQEVLMDELGVDRVFLDKLTGKNTDRPALKEMLAYVRGGDTVYVESLSRLGRNTKELLEIVDTFEKKGVEFKSQKENLDTTNPAGKFTLQIFAAVAEMEREYLLQRQREGIELAKAEGKYKGRKPISKPDNWDMVYEAWSRKEISMDAAAKLTGMSRSTFWRKAREEKGLIDFGE